MTTGCTPGGGAAPQLVRDTSDSGSRTGSAASTQIPITTAEVQKLVYHVGPIDLPKGTTAEEMLRRPAKLAFQVEEAVWVTGFTPKVVDDQGSALPGSLLHKAVLFNKHEENPICNTSTHGNPFAAANATLTKISLPDGFGYALLPEDALEVRAIFQNTTDEDLFGVYFSFELEAVPMKKAKGIHDVKPLLLDIDPCNYQPIAVKPGEFREESKSFAVPNSGKLLVANGILSDRGVLLSLTHNGGSTASVVPFWLAEAELDELHRIINLAPNPFVDEVGKEMKAGDKLVLGTAFNNFSDRWQNDATAAAMVYLAPSAE